MNPRSEELELARSYTETLEFEGLSDDQLLLLMTRGRILYKWFKNHPYVHSLISAAVILFLAAADFSVLLLLPRLWLRPHEINALLSILVASAVVGILHSWIMYSLGVYSLHEGATHKVIFPSRGAIGRAAGFFANNLCRVAGAEPEYYSAHHMSHHAKFGTTDDGEFLNFVLPLRYWLTFLPMAAVFNFSDFVIHRPLRYTRGRLVTGAWSAMYQGLYGYFIYRSFGLLFTLLVLVVLLPHVGFYIDRLRQFTEHNLMPLDNKNGSRSFGIGFWGLLVGGGPWGSPCHWEHHLVASLPWYQQISLHRYVKTLLTQRQRRQFLIEPVIGFPKLWWRLLRESNSFLRRRLTTTRRQPI